MELLNVPKSIKWDIQIEHSVRAESAIVLDLLMERIYNGIILPYLAKHTNTPLPRLIIHLMQTNSCLNGP